MDTTISKLPSKILEHQKWLKMPSVSRGYASIQFSYKVANKVFSSQIPKTIVFMFVLELDP